MPYEYISVGEFSKPHGILGKLLLIPYNPSTDIFNSGKSLFINKGKVYETLDIEGIRSVSKGFLVKISGIGSIEEATKYMKMRVFVKKDDVELGKDEHLISSLINLDCYNLKEENIGTVTEVFQGETDILEVKSSSGTFLIPMVSENIIGVDYKNLRINVRNEENFRI